MEQKILVLSSFTALQFWLSAYSSYARFSVEKRELVKLPRFCRPVSDQEFVKDLAEEYHLSLPLQIMVDHAEQRLNNGCLKSCLHPSGIPEKSFLKLDDTVYICCPELCFLQIVSFFSIGKLTEIANNLCAQYVPDKLAGFLQKRRAPIMNIESLKAYIKETGRVKGKEKAGRVLRYTLDGSCSPVESKLAVLASLPYSLGGYALKGMLLNCNLKLSSAAAALLGRPMCCCDGVWKKEKVVIEYDSNLVHTDPTQQTYDKRKVTALTLSGYIVITVTANNIRNHKAIEDLFQNLRIATGRQPRKERMEKHWNVRWETVSELFFSKKNVYGDLIL